MNAELKQELLAFLEARAFCVVSTVDDKARPEAAFVAYASNSDLEIIIGTSNQSRKYHNLTQHKSVALVIADMEGEVQYEGDVDIISTEDYEALMAEGRFKELSGFEKYRNDPTQVYLHVKPTWLRFIVHGETDRIEELRQFA